MTLQVVFRAAARQEFEEAVSWYDQQCKGLGEEFLREIDDVVRRAATHPKRYPIITKDIRRAVTRRFPYSIFFRTRGRKLVVLAVFHARRDPMVWQRRV